jgi:hypothetical protein
VVARTVVARDARAIEDEDDRKVQQSHVEVRLVERSREERRVDRDHRFQAAHRHTGRRGHRVLLGDADVEESLGELLLEIEQSRRSGHRRGDGDDAVVGAGEVTRESEKAWENDCGATTSSSCRGGNL